MMLEKQHDSFAVLKQNRNQTEQELAEVRDQYKQQMLSVNDEKKKGLWQLEIHSGKRAEAF